MSLEASVDALSFSYLEDGFHHSIQGPSLLNGILVVDSICRIQLPKEDARWVDIVIMTNGGHKKGLESPGPFLVRTFDRTILMGF
jgi:hypothetical protein